MTSPAQARIAVTADGPYIVTGSVPLLRVAAEPACRGEWTVDAALPARQSYALCRCGRSRMPPFCDYKHLRGGFDGTETADRSVANNTTDPGMDRPPAIGFASTGPFFVRGAVDIVASDGARYAASGPLCRCGASMTKPFCDGSHCAAGTERS